MNEKNKKIYSTILMSVGVLFIIVSGGIFASKTWQYLPEAVKKLCLLVITGGLFAGSHIAGKKGGLKKTSTAFYYLAVCFTGFTSLSLLEWLQTGLYLRLIIALLAMSIPVVLHFAVNHNGADCLIQMLLSDGIAVCIWCWTMSDGLTMDKVCSITAFTVSTVMMLLSVFIQYCQNSMPQEQGSRIGAIVFYCIHAVIALPHILITDNIFPAILLTASVSVLYRAWHTKEMRIVQSLTLFYLNLAIARFIIHNFFGDMTTGTADTIFFIAFLLNIGITLLLDRREMLITNGIFATLCPLVQLFIYLFCHYDIFDSCVYYPFAGCMALALASWKYFRKTETGWPYILKLSGLWLIMEINTLAAFANKDYSIYYSFAFWFAILFLQASLLCHNIKTLASLWETFALLSVLRALLSNPFFSTFTWGEGASAVIIDFTLEYRCVLLGAGIALSGLIWYDKRKAIRTFQFIAVCILLGVLVCGNLAAQALPNILFLGISTLIMLLAATVMGQKSYAIAAALTLVLVVFYLTKAVWMSIAWWIYLFAAGVGLVIYAIKREKSE